MDTRVCKFCGSEFKDYRCGGYLGIDIDGTFAEGYCDKSHRRAHENQLIKEGKLQSVRDFCRDIDVGFVTKDMQYTDAIGQPIWFPKDEKPYYDRFLKQTFHSKKQKSEWMKQNRKCMDGSETPGFKECSGDVRDKSYRRAMRMDD